MLSQERRFFSFSRSIFVLLLISAWQLLLAVGCGGGGGGNGGDVEPPPPSPTSVQFKIGDAPADCLVGLEVTLTAMHIRDSNGNQINVLPASRRLEFLHTAGTSEPVALLDIPQGTYSAATFEASNLHVSWVSHPETGLTLEEATITDLDPVTVTISPALTVGSTPMIVSIDFDVASFISFDPEGYPILNEPKFTVTTSAINTSDPGPEEGELEDMYGTVNEVSATDFILNIGQNAMPLGFTTDSNTVFENVTLSTLPGTIAKVSGITRADGSVLAKEVEALESSASGVETEGVVYVYWGAETWFWLTPQDGNGVGFEFNPTGAVGQVVNVTMGDGTSFAANTDGMDMTGVNYVFDPNVTPTSLRFGQRVRVESSTGMINDPGGTQGLIAADEVILEKQAVSGTVRSYGQIQGGNGVAFLLDLPAESYLSILNSVQWPPATQIVVWQQAGTHLHGISSIQDGDTVHVRGLLFTEPGGWFVLIAQRIWK